MELNIVNHLSEGEFTHLFKWDDVVFPIEGKKFKWAKTKHSIVAYDVQALPVAHIGFSNFSVTLNSSQTLDVVGIGSVVVRPEYQGQHLLNKLFSLLHTCKDAKNISDTFVLFCPHRRRALRTDVTCRPFQYRACEF